MRRVGRNEESCVIFAAASRPAAVWPNPRPEPADFRSRAIGAISFNSKKPCPRKSGRNWATTAVCMGLRSEAAASERQLCGRFGPSSTKSPGP